MKFAPIEALAPKPMSNSPAANEMSISPAPNSAPTPPSSTTSTTKVPSLSSLVVTERFRSEERRVGKECRAGCAPPHRRKKRPGREVREKRRAQPSTKGGNDRLFTLCTYE